MNKINFLLTIAAGSFDPLTKPITNAGTSALSALLQVATIFAAVAIVYFKIRTIMADVQEDQVYSKKINKILSALVFIFLAETIVSVVKSFFS